MKPATLLETLPNDVAQCHALITHLRAHATHLHAHVEEQAKTIAEQQALTARMQQQLETLLRRLYGPRSERIDPAQLVLFAQDVAASQQEAEASPEEEAPVPAPAKKQGHGRKPLPKDLPRQRLVHDVPEGEKACPTCEEPKRRIGEDIREQIEYVPASLFILEHVYPKYACCECEEHVSMAPAAPRVIEKGLPGPGLIAHIITSKYCDHLPLYRQEFMLARHGVEFSRKTLCGWVMTTAEKVQRLVDVMKEDVLASKVIHTDDTPVRVQGNGKNGPFTGRFWVYAGDDAHPYTVYDYTPSRKRDGPAAFLDGYKGYLQADAFGGYDGIYASGDVIEVACWAHARRKFYEARSTDPDRAHRVLAWIRQLYDVEREGKKLDPEERRALRQAKSKPIFDGVKTSEGGDDIEGFKDWLVKQQATLLPRSPIGDAVNYALNNWAALTRYLDDGDLDIDNNTAEQALRGIAIGRKNWLFLGSDRGGRAAANHYTLIQSAKRHGIDPFAYLRDVLLRLTTEPDVDLRELLPDRWKAALKS